MDEWVNKIYSDHITQYLSAIKRNEILIYAITRMKLKKILLSTKTLDT